MSLNLILQTVLLRLQGFDLKPSIPPLFVFNVIVKVKKIIVVQKNT